MLHRTGRVLLRVLLGIVILVVTVFILVQVPAVQNYAKDRFVVYLEKRLNTNVEVGKLYIDFPRHITLEDVYIEDLQKDTLISGGDIKIDVNMVKLLRNEFEIHKIEMKDLTAKLKRELPDTTYNFQFVLDAFIRDKKDTSVIRDTTAIKFMLDEVVLDNINVLYKDVINGSDMHVRLGHLDTRMDNVDPQNLVFDVPLMNVSNTIVTIRQHKPIIEPTTKEEDLAEAEKPIAMNIDFDRINLDNFVLDYKNDVSALYTFFNIGNLRAIADTIDLQSRIVHLRTLDLDTTTTSIRLGKKEGARIIEKEIKQNLQAEAETNDWRFVVDSLQINRNNFSFDNDNNPRTGYGMDYSHMKGDTITLHATNVLFTLDTIAGIIQNARFSEQSGFVLHHLSAEFLYGPYGTYLKNMHIVTPGTDLRNYTEIRYASLDRLAEDVGQMEMYAEFEESYVQIKDILTFAPMLRNQPLFSRPYEVWYLDGNLEGKLANLTTDRLRMRGMQNTNIDITGNLRGLPEPDAIAGNIVIHSFTTTRSDLKRMAPALPSNFTIPERISASGTLSGSLARVNGNLNLNTSLGGATINGTFGNLTNPDRITYNALINARGLQLGTIMGNPQIGNVTGTIRANGTGFDPAIANIKANGTINAIHLNGYTYRNIKFDGNIASGNYTIDADINDPNLVAQLKAEGAMANTQSLRITGMIENINTKPLGLTKEDMAFHGKIDGDFSNIDPNNLAGELLLTEAVLVSGGKRYVLDTVRVNSGIDASGQRYLTFGSDVIGLNISGQYQLTQLGVIFQDAIQPYFTVLPPSTRPVLAPYDFTIKGYLTDQPLLKLLIPGLGRTDSVYIDGDFSSVSGWNATVKAPLLEMNGNRFRDMTLVARTTDGRLRVDATMAQFTSGTQMDIYNATIGADIANNNIDFDLNIKDKGGKTKYNVAGLLTQPTFQSYVLSLSPDSLMLNYQDWTVNATNRIYINSKNISADNLTLSNGEQSLTLNSLNPSPGSPVDAIFKNFKLSTITGFMQADSAFLDGELTGTARLLSFTPQPTFTADLNIQNFRMNNDTVGHIALNVNNQTSNTYAVVANITGFGNDVVLTGNYRPTENNSLDLVADVRALQLGRLQGISNGIIRDASGYMTGKLNVTGTLTDPDLEGELGFKNSSFIVSAIGSQFRIDDQNISVRDNGIFFNEFTIRDSANNVAVIDGAAYTENFVDYFFNMYLNTNNFRVLNSTKKDNKLFYGQLYLTSDINLMGSSFQPVVDGNLVVNDGTRMTIVMPQKEPSVEQRDGIVQFVDFDAPGIDSIYNEFDSVRVSNLLGFDVSGNIEVTKGAEFNLIIDETNGDFINMRGEAMLTAGIDKSGHTTLVGSYEVESGAYEISFNFLRRRFEIEKRSRIVWTGEPTRAQLDVQAKYIANAAPFDLVKNYIAEASTVIRNTYLQKLPFEVYLKLTGELLQPVVSFDITLPPEKNYNVTKEIITTVDTRLTQLREDPSELNKQVFSLLLLNRFVDENPFDNSGGGLSTRVFARQTVSKILTEQLNQLIKGTLAGFEVNFDILSSDDYTTGELRYRTDLNVSLSRRMLNDRLEVSIGSNFELEGPQNSNQQSSNIAGDLMVNYLLSKDGRFILRFYRRNEYEGIIEGYVVETGLGFVMSVDYNKFNEIFKGRKIRREMKKEVERLKQVNDSTTIKPPVTDSTTNSPSN